MITKQNEPIFHLGFEVRVCNGDTPRLTDGNQTKF